MQSHPWTAEKINLIAAAVLEVLVYLQAQVPSMIHQDIKTENILVARQHKLQVYLVDFQFASFGDREVLSAVLSRIHKGFSMPNDTIPPLGNGKVILQKLLLLLWMRRYW